MVLLLIEKNGEEFGSAFSRKVYLVVEVIIAEYEFFIHGGAWFTLEEWQEGLAYDQYHKPAPFYLILSPFHTVVRSLVGNVLIQNCINAVAFQKSGECSHQLFPLSDAIANFLIVELSFFQESPLDVAGLKLRPFWWTELCVFFWIVRINDEHL